MGHEAEDGRHLVCPCLYPQAQRMLKCRLKQKLMPGRLFGSWGVDFVKNDGCVDPECAQLSLHDCF